MYGDRIGCTNGLAGEHGARSGLRQRAWVALWALACGVGLTGGTALAQEGGQTGAADQKAPDHKAQDASQEPPSAEEGPQEKATATGEGKKAAQSRVSKGAGGGDKASSRDGRRGKNGPQGPIATETPTGPVTGAPAIRCSETVKEFGLRWAGPPAQHTFTLRNEGDQSLEIQKVKTSCGCTVARNWTRKIPPGGEGSIPVTLATTRVGTKFSKTITVSSNDPVTPRLQLKIQGELKRPVDMQPARIDFGQVKANTKETQVATLTNNMARPLELTMPERTREGPFSVELVEQEPGKVYEIKVQAKPPYQPKLNRAKFEVKTNLSEQPQVSITVSAILRPRLDVNPEQLTVKKAEPRERTQYLRFANNGQTPVKVLSAQADDENLRLLVKEQEEGKQYQILVTIPADYMPPQEGRTITIKTDDPEMPEMTVPVVGRPLQMDRRPATGLVGKPAPSFEFPTFDDKVVSSEEYQGKVVLLDFYASWCGFCKKQLPVVSDLYKRKYADNAEVRFLAISEDRIGTGDEAKSNKRARTKEQVATYYAKIGGAFPAVLDPTGIGGSHFLIKNRDYPAIVLIGQDGIVQAVHFREATDLSRQLAIQIDTLLSGKSREAFPPDAPPIPVIGARQSRATVGDASGVKQGTLGKDGAARPGKSTGPIMGRGKGRTAKDPAAGAKTPGAESDQGETPQAGTPEREAPQTGPADSGQPKAEQPKGQAPGNQEPAGGDK
ncbi:MAG TPA: DUF1573 domain-containing protein [Phycisphaerae bacterium]|nr:DUF1573 domain-containing protein [Phycisphaerae bacterium]